MGKEVSVMNIMDDEKFYDIMYRIESLKYTIKGGILTVDTLLYYTQYFPNDFIHYFEAIILPNGTVKLAIPSHIECVIRLVCELENITRDELKLSIPSSADPLRYLLDKYCMVSVWYNTIITPESISPLQEQTISSLESNGLISPNYSRDTTCEYRYYEKN